MLSIFSAITVCAFSACGDGFVPVAEVQAALTAVIERDYQFPTESEVSAAIEAEFEKILVLCRQDQIHLLEQLLYNVGHRDYGDKGWQALSLYKLLTLTESEKLSAALTFLCLPATNAQPGFVLHDIETGRAGSEAVPYFGVYESWAEDAKATHPEGVDALLNYMIHRHPPLAIASALKIKEVPESKRARIEQDLEIVNEAFKKNTRLDAQIDQEVSHALERLAGESAWWVKAYVAEVMLKKQAYRDEAVLSKLKNSSDARVLDRVENIYRKMDRNN